MAKPTTIDQYIATFPKDVQTLIEQVRETIKKTAPDAKETISYSIPAFKLGAMLVWFGAHTNHIGLYPRGSAIEAFQKELSPYKSTKGSVQFPFNQPIPLKLIAKIVKFRVDENMERAANKKNRIALKLSASCF